MSKPESKGTELIERMGGDRLPAVPHEPAEPREPEEPSRDLEPGRSPEEVLGEQDERVPAAPVEDESKPPAEKKTWLVDGQQLTLKEITDRGLLDKLITTAQQLPTVQKKYLDLLEKDAKGVDQPSKVPAKEVEPPPSPEKIKTLYTPMLQKAVADGHMEADFAEAFPQHAVELMFFRDIIETMEVKMGHVVAWIASQVQQKKLNEQKETRDKLDQAIDTVASMEKDGKPDPIVQKLKDSEERGKFVGWLRDEVDPKTTALTPENIYKFWLVYNADDFLELTKQSAKKVATPSSKRRATGDGTGSRPGSKEAPQDKSLLERMSEEKLGAEQ